MRLNRTPGVAPGEHPEKQFRGAPHFARNRVREVQFFARCRLQGVLANVKIERRGVRETGSRSTDREIEIPGRSARGHVKVDGV